MENLPQLDVGKSRDAAGKAVGVSGKSVDYAAKVINQGVPALVEAVDSASITFQPIVRNVMLAKERQKRKPKSVPVNLPEQNAGL